jgi:A/G-specific adenine glycosylase
MTPRIRRAFTLDLVAWYRTYGRAFPWRQTRDPFRLLVAEILLQRTPYWKAAPAYAALIALAPTPAALACLTGREIARIIRPLGLVGRAQVLVDLGMALVERHGGTVPHDFKELVKLPGVGRYTASATQCHAFGIDTPLVDGLTGRVYRRVLNLDDRVEPHADEALWAAVASIHPPNPSQFHLAVIDLASLICRRGRPLCEQCPLAAVCRSRRRLATPATHLRRH